jgi:hypothetical protein
MPAKGSGVTSLTRLKQRCSLASNTRECCWVWKWSAKRLGQAAIHVRVDGKEKVVTGAWAALHLTGRTPAPGVRTWASCGNKLCCNPDHAMSGSYAEFGKWQKETGALLGNPRRLAVATKGGRSRSAINMEIARQMRDSPLSATQEAKVWSERLGRTISHDVVSDLRRGKSWQETSPFAGLM